MGITGMQGAWGDHEVPPVPSSLLWQLRLSGGPPHNLRRSSFLPAPVATGSSAMAASRSAPSVMV